MSCTEKCVCRLLVLILRDLFYYYLTSTVLTYNTIVYRGISTVSTYVKITTVVVHVSWYILHVLSCMYVGSGTYSTCFKASTYVLVHFLPKTGSGTGSTYCISTKTGTERYVGSLWYCLHVFCSTYVALWYIFYVIEGFFSVSPV
jgi:hypothetical protein